MTELCTETCAANIHSLLTTSGLFIGKVVERRDTLTAHDKSYKHVSCQLISAKNKIIKGDLDKALNDINKALNDIKNSCTTKQNTCLQTFLKQ